MLKRRWDRFMCPNGIRRTFNPRKWEHGTAVLVFGELLALGAASAAIPGWPHGQWFLYAAPIIAAGALAWYALDKSSLGEMPLTGVSANRIANVARLVDAEEKLGPVIQWSTISADGTTVEMGYSQMKPEVRPLVAQMVREMLTDSKTWLAPGIRASEVDDDTLLRVLDNLRPRLSAPSGNADKAQG